MNKIVYADPDVAQYECTPTTVNQLNIGDVFMKDGCTFIKLSNDPVDDLLSSKPNCFNLEREQYCTCLPGLEVHRTNSLNLITHDTFHLP